VINPIQIQQKADRLYTNFLQSLFTGESFFPIEFTAGSLPKEYLDLSKAVNLLIDKSKQQLGYGYSLELESRRMQKHGSQSLPKRISIDTEQDYLKLIKKEKEVRQFRLDVELIRTKVPNLAQWICLYPLKVIEYGDRWNDLLKVCQYFQHTPKPNLYIRELPIQVHTKFIEQNQKILRSLLEAMLASEQLGAVDGEKEHIFEKRFSLKYREPLIRFRLLDRTLKAKYGFPVNDFSLPISEFNQLTLEEHHCFITENLMNFLTLPDLENSFAIFGSGYAVQSLKFTQWLSRCQIFYWGDLDADGFKILSQLRSYFPQVISIMMDTKTFETFQEFSVSVPEANLENLQYLTSEEANLYNYLMLHHKRLEQERIRQDYVDRFLLEIATSFLPKHL
jgi:hypothetical protein